MDAPPELVTVNYDSDSDSDSVANATAQMEYLTWSYDQAIELYQSRIQLLEKAVIELSKQRPVYKVECCKCGTTILLHQ